MMPDRYIEAPDVSSAWLDALRMLEAGGRPYKAVHLLLRIADPTVEVQEIRCAAQDLIDTVNGDSDRLPHIETTRNTIFPAAFARRNPEPADLAAYYRARYEDLRGYKNNEKGTYFGRIVAHPIIGGEPVDQLTSTVKKIRDETADNTVKSSRYEISIYNPSKDGRTLMSFPCLAHLSVHLHEGRLHMQAVYRNESLVPRGYGNYLGLGELQAYMAAQTGTDPGELLMTLGHVEIGVPITPVRAMLRVLGA